MDTDFVGPLVLIARVSRQASSSRHERERRVRHVFSILLLGAEKTSRHGA